MLKRKRGLAVPKPSKAKKTLHRRQSVRTDAIFDVSPDGCVIAWHTGAQQTFGYTEAEMLGVHISIVFTAADTAAAVRAQELSMELGAPVAENQSRLVRKDGSEFFGSRTVEPILGADRDVVGFRTLVRDVIEAHPAIEPIAAKDDWLRLLIESVCDYAIFSTDAAGYVTSWNAGAVKMFGYAEHEVAGRDLELLAVPTASARGILQEELAEAARTGGSCYERWLVRRDGTRLFASGTIRRMMSADDGTVRGFVTIAQDITERTRIADELTHRALYDDLTDLPNRRLFYDNVHRAIALNKRHPESLFAVLFIDLDHFKRVNDDLGHVFADSVLVHTARLLQECVRSEDIVARLGGDEFAVLLNGVSGPAAAREAAERIEVAMRRPLAIAQRECAVSASIGIALSTGDYATPQDVLRDADEAMYAAKRAGRSQVAFFGETRAAHAATAPNLLTDLRDGIERGELVIAYQPIVSVRSLDLLGFEALVRWEHPVRGLLQPAAFLAQAEGSDIIIALDRWVLRRACAQLHYWESLDTHSVGLQMSVNVSAKEFSLPGFLAYLQSIVSEFSLRPGCLRLEISTAAMIERSDVRAKLLVDIRALGIDIHIDDFGTGYSGLTLVRDMLVDAIKIDRTYIAMINSSHGSRLVGIMTELAAMFGLTAIAECVETTEQLRFIRAVGCDAAQGFLFSRPLDADEATKFLHSANTP